MSAVFCCAPRARGPRAEGQRGGGGAGGGRTLRTLRPADIVSRGILRGNNGHKAAVHGFLHLPTAALLCVYFVELLADLCLHPSCRRRCAHERQRQQRAPRAAGALHARPRRRAGAASAAMPLFASDVISWRGLLDTIIIWEGAPQPPRRQWRSQLPLLYSFLLFCTVLVKKRNSFPRC